MLSKFDKLVELSELIKKENIEHPDELPDSQRFVKFASSHFAESPENINQWLKILFDSHYIFIINIAHPDEGKEDARGLDAYVYAEKPLMEILRSNAEKRLEKIYEGTYYKKASPSSIERELFAQVKTLNNTPMGRALHEYVSLRNTVMLVDSKEDEYSEEYKSSHLREILRDIGDDSEAEEEEIEAEEVVVETKKRREDPTINPNSPWGRLTRKYSSDVLLRVHFRKYEFSVIKKLVRLGRINSDEELKFIRELAMKMEKEAKTNPIVRHNLKELIDLRRYVQARMNIKKQEELERMETDLTEVEDDEVIF